MEPSRPRKSPLTERFLGSLSSTSETPTPATTGAAGSISGGGELEEGEVFWVGSDFSSPNTASPVNSASAPSSGSPRRVATEKNFGILAALPEDGKKRVAIRNQSLLQRKSSMLSSASSNSSFLPSSSTTSSRMMIPVVPKPRQEHSYSLPTGRGYQQSAPVNVPMAARRGARVEEAEADDVGNDEDDEMLPPHEIVARASARDSPMSTFSVLEGVGRTLKGRDLRRVRNAVWRQTGFLD